MTSPTGWRRAWQRSTRLLFVVALATMGMVAVPAVANAATTVSDAAALTNAFASGGDITLGDDITVDHGLVLDSGKTLTIDLGRHSLTVDGPAGPNADADHPDGMGGVSALTNAGTLILRNGTLQATGGDGSDGLDGVDSHPGGGNGGPGGAALSSSGTLALWDVALDLTGGDGGNGGAGAASGNGGDGGVGGDYYAINPAGVLLTAGETGAKNAGAGGEGRAAGAGGTAGADGERGGTTLTDSSRSTVTFEATSYADTPQNAAVNTTSGLALSKAVDLLNTSAAGADGWPSRSGFAFGGWFTAPSDGTALDASDVVSGQTYYAHWTPEGSGTAGGADRYVETTGSDTDNNCLDAGTPCQTISHALDTVFNADPFNPAETVHVAAGTYDEALAVTKSVAIQGSDGVVLTDSAGSGSATIQISAGDATHPVAISDVEVRPRGVEDTGEIAISLSAGSNAVLSQVTVDSTGPDAAVIGVAAAGGSTVTINDSTLSAVGPYGIALGDPADLTAPASATAFVNNTTISGNAVGIVAAGGSTVTISGGEVSGNSAAGILGAGANVTVNVAGTSIASNGLLIGGTTTSAGIALQSGGAVTLTDATIDRNRLGILIDGGGTLSMSDSVVSNNGLDGSTGDGIRASSQSHSGFDTAPLALTLSGATISGNAEGIMVDGGDLAITDSTISDNTVSGISFENSLQVPDLPTLTVADSTISGNGFVPTGSTGSGMPLGGIVSSTPVDITVKDSQVSGSVRGIVIGDRSQLAVTDSVIDNNIIGVTAAGNSNVTVTDSKISDNSSVGITSGSGGGPASLDLTDTLITGNGVAPDPDNDHWSPVGLMVQGTQVTGTRLTIDGNANGILQQGGELALTDSSVTGSVASTSTEASQTGIGIVSFGGTAEIERSTISGNDESGLVALNEAGVVVRTSTIADNGAFGISGALPVAEGPDLPPATLLLANSTVAGNAEGALNLADEFTMKVGGSILQAPDGKAVCVDGELGFSGGLHNLASDATCAWDNTSNALPARVLGPLTNNGGPTLTMMPAADSDAVDGILDSSSISLGSTSVQLCDSTVTDQRGVARPQGLRCDIGAVEFTTTSTPTCDAASFEAGFNGAADGTTVTMECDVTISATDRPLAVAAGRSLTLDLNGHDLTVTAPNFTAGIGVPAGASLTIKDTGDGGTVTATGGQDGAGIGGNYLGSGGTITILGGTVTATGGQDGAGIGGGYAGNGGNITISGGTVTATGVGGGAGFGGGFGGSSNGGGGGGVVTINGDAVVTAVGVGGGPGIGSGSFTRLLGATVQIGESATVTASSDWSANAIGTGTADGGVNPDFGSLTNAGKLILPAGSHISIPSGETVTNTGTIANSGTISGAGSVTGAGTIANHGSIQHTVSVGADTSVTVHNYEFTFDGNGGTASAPTSLVVYGPSLKAVGYGTDAMPTATRSGYTLDGWNTQEDGSGTAVDVTNLLAGSSDDGTAVPITLYAQWKSDSVDPGTTDPGTTDPGTSDPGTSNPSADPNPPVDPNPPAQPADPTAPTGPNEPQGPFTPENLPPTPTETGPAYVVDGKVVTPVFGHGPAGVTVTFGGITISTGARDADGNLIPGSAGALPVLPGGMLGISTEGFGTGSWAFAWIYSSPTYLGSFKIGAGGSGTLQVPLPASLPPGKHTLVISGTNADGAEVTARIPAFAYDPATYVSPARQAAEPVATESLAATGVSPDLVPLGLVAALAVILGSALLWARPRRRV